MVHTTGHTFCLNASPMFLSFLQPARPMCDLSFTNEGAAAQRGSTACPYHTGNQLALLEAWLEVGSTAPRLPAPLMLNASLH